jgi:TolB protein
VSGEDQDPSGYTVVLDDQPRDFGFYGGSVGLQVPAGSHKVEMADRTASCPVKGDSSRTVFVPPNGNVTVDFEITCTLSPRAGRGQEIVFETNRAGTNPQGSDYIEFYSVNADGTGLQLLSTSLEGTREAASWSSDGSRLLFKSTSLGFETQIFIMNADGSGVARYLDVNGEPAWSPDMGRLALSVLDEGADDFEAFGIGTVPFENATPGGIHYYTFAGRLSRPSWSPDGTRLVYVRRNFFPDGEGGSRDMEILDLSTRVSDTLPISLKGFEDPQWSPDGEWLLFSASTDFGPQDLYLMRADGTDPPIQLTDTPADEITPAWSPDGRQIAFATNRDGNYEIYVMNADGTHPVRLTNDPASDGRPAWRP